MRRATCTLHAFVQHGCRSLSADLYHRKSSSPRAGRGRGSVEINGAGLVEGCAHNVDQLWGVARPWEVLFPVDGLGDSIFWSLG